MKADKLLDLHRRWRAKDGSATAYWGLYEFSPPDEDYAAEIGLNLFSMERLLADRPCMFLLGRPGAGKTAEYSREFKARISEEECVIPWEARQLASVDSIFNGLDWQAALVGSKPVRLVLDSVDEALLGRASFLDELTRQLQIAKAALEKRNLAFRLVLTCRTEWSDKAGDELAELWGQSGARSTFELAPLSQEAAVRLAKAHGVDDPRAFISDVAAADMISYACWPRTLIWLAGEYARSGAISSSLTELHAKRCDGQFEERDRTDRISFSPAEVAEMNEAIQTVAAASIATGRQRIVLDRPADEWELDLAALATSVAKIAGADVSATHQRFAKALRCGSLFAPIGTAWMFQEQSDAEFLAARRLASMPVEEIAGFLGKEGRNGWEIFPQLYATAAMTAVHCRDFRQWLLEHDPLVLLRTDFKGLAQEEKEEAVAAFLALIDSGQAPDAHDQPTQLQTLGHPKLGPQLRPWLCESSRSVAAREMALRIAAECADPSLQNELGDDIWKLAVGPEADTLEHLPQAILKLGAAWPKSRLMAIVTGKAPSGRHWNSRAAALFALLDRQRSRHPLEEQAKLSEVLPYLENNPTGVWSSYETFIRSCVDFFWADDPVEIGAVLKELKAWRAPLDSIGDIYKLAMAALRAAVSLLDHEQVLAALCDWWFAAIFQENCQIPGRSNTCDLAAIGLDVPAKRLALLSAMLRHPLAVKLSDRHIKDLPAVAADYGWMLIRLCSVSDLEEKVLSRLAASLTYRKSLREANVPALRAAYLASSEFRALLPVTENGDIHGTLCRLAEEQDRRWKTDRARPETPPKIDAEAEFAKELDFCRTGDDSSWPWLLVSIGRFQSENAEDRVWDVSDPRELDGWGRISLEDLPYVTDSARSYLLSHPPNLPSRGESHFGMQATKLALALLSSELRTNAVLKSAFRAEWVEVIVRSLYPSRAPLPTLLATFLAMNAKITIEVIRAQLEYDWQGDRYLAADYLDLIWSPALQAMLEGILSQSPLQPRAYRSGIAFLNGHNRPFAAALALMRCDELAAGPSLESRRVAIGIALLAFPENWERVWPWIASAGEEGLHCLGSVADSVDLLGFKRKEPSLVSDEEGHNLSAEPVRYPEHVATLYGWLLKHLPTAPIARFGHSPDAFDDCRDLESKCFEVLSRLGRHDLLQKAFAFAEIADRPWTARVTRRVERNALAQQWQPWALPDFIQWLNSNGGTRLTDNDALLRAVEASLHEFARGSISDQIPLHNLWDMSKKVPLRERYLSDELKAHLRRDLPGRFIPRATLPFINREPEFFSGEATDIHIEVPLIGGAKGTVVVEVKLCDHPSVEESMETQLVDRYLREKSLTHGVYFVGWYVGKTWPKSKRPFQRRGLTAARRFLGKKASALSKGGFQVRAVLASLVMPKRLDTKSDKAKRGGAKVQKPILRRRSPEMSSVPSRA